VNMEKEMSAIIPAGIVGLPGQCVGNKGTQYLIGDDL